MLSDKRYEVKCSHEYSEYHTLSRASSYRHYTDSERAMSSYSSLESYDSPPPMKRPFVVVPQPYLDERFNRTARGWGTAQASQHRKVHHAQNNQVDAAQCNFTCTHYKVSPACARTLALKQVNIMPFCRCCYLN